MSEITHGMPLSFADAIPVKQDPDLGELISPEFSDDNLALRFTAKHDNALLYVPLWGKWLRWDGCRYKDDQTLNVFDSARRVCREESAKCGEKERSIAKKINSAVTVSAVERLARCDPRHARTPDQFDADTWSLNTPGGYLNLKTGELLPHRQGRHVTKLTAVSPGGDCPIWLNFLHRVTGGNSELISYLQRVAGYCCTGRTTEQALFFLYGTGANGKGTFVNTIHEVLADYAQAASMETFCESKNPEHPTSLAVMRGSRLVSASETTSGRRWDEAKIKTLTGGDPVRARFMRCDSFEYTPQFKLVIFGNHKPGLRAVNEAIRRRIHLIPFTVVIPKEERDLDLADKLKAEWTGILQWAIDGCLAWQREGLNPPQAVLSATEEYLANEDKLGRWIEECCVLSNTYATNSSALFQNFKAWCEKGEERPGSQKSFAQELTERGIEGEHTRAGKMFVGIGLRSDVV
jgi:putative DNA primase/helicase